MAHVHRGGRFQASFGLSSQVKLVMNMNAYASTRDGVQTDVAASSALSLADLSPFFWAPAAGFFAM